ncbi:MAG: NAD(P)-dependent oxidoreductase [Thalassospira sp.]|uniref:SDR family oxidoreductase n=1 Tax=unclassified Thalassospira TaxID=2648997 RepID=UPI000C554EFF|nr:MULTISPECIES: SDR family oxidoreductase [unclassified Thalassospira]MBE70603.1 NAD(P)-dependent oxidoreductase [Thalassospira sp.]QPO10748.1 SDR family oxidoreductase [Thalassospira sp. A40-3]|tara:strand:+ start:570 stop:1328 length:759 start_codon:yes stop_codon:yes gene_type:complete
MTKTALITGATSGFGAATARRFVKEGWKVIVTGRRAERLDALVDELGGASVAHALCFDIQDADATRNAINSLPADFAEIDLLVNNAGLALGTGPAQECNLSDWMTMIDTNTKGLVAITRILLDKLIERKGAIVNLASIASNWPYPGGNVYGATKAFVQQFSLGIRCDLAGTGVRVTSIEPGLCESEFTLVRTGGNKEAYDKLYSGADPIQPEDIAESIFWVANLPAHVNVNSLEVMPVSQSWSPFAIHRKQA